MRDNLLITLSILWIIFLCKKIVKLLIVIKIKTTRGV